MELGTAHQVPRHRSASASVLTMLFCLLAGLLAALVTLPFAPGARSYRWVFLAAPVLLICLLPQVINRILDRLLRLARRPPLEQPLAGRAVAGALAWALASWVFSGCRSGCWRSGSARRTGGPRCSPSAGSRSPGAWGLSSCSPRPGPASGRRC